MTSKATELTTIAISTGVVIDALELLFEELVATPPPGATTDGVKDGATDGVVLEGSDEIEGSSVD